MASGLMAGAALASVLGWVPFVHHDKPAQPAEHHKKIKYDKHRVAATLPGQVGGARYRNEGGAVLVPVTVHDRGPYPMMVDTGSANSSLDADTAFKAQIGFWGENASPPSTVKEPSARRLAATAFNVGDAPLFSAAPHALYKPYNLVGHSRGRLGRDVLGGYVVRIDPRYRMISFHDPLRITKPVNAVELPLTVTADGIYLPVTLRLSDGTAVTRNARLDTGLPWTMADDAATIGRIKAVDLGTWSVPQAAGQGPGVGAPTVGMGLLQGFIVTIDVPDHRIWLQSAGRYKPDFQYTARTAKAPKADKPKKKKRFIIV
jgi:hypothetical protein